MNQKQDLIQEAIDRGYKTGTIIDYNGILTGTDTLGNGEFAMKDGNLIKYEKKLENDNPNHRRFDTIWRKETGWTKIVDKPYGFAL